MKKNLFGAVSVALALALAITSFGCESGSDDPIRIPTDKDAAEWAKAKFEYVAKPTCRTAAVVDPTATTAGEWSGNATNHNYEPAPGYYVDGALAWNTYKATKKTENAAGDHKKTTSETVTLNYDGTFSYSKSTYTYDLLGLVLSDATVINNVNVDTGIANAAAKTTAQREDNLAQYRETAIANKKAVADADTDANKTTAYAAAKTSLLKYWFLEGAYFLSEEVSDASGAKTYTLTAYDKLEDGKKVIGSYTVTIGKAAAAATGKYTIDGNFKNATVVVTSITKDGTEWTFNDTNNTFTVAGATAAPQSELAQSANQGNNVFCKAARKLSIVNGVLTAPMVQTSASGTTESSMAYDNLLSNSYTGNVTATTYQNAKVSYNYNLK